ncbi:CobW family GTP-binding protein [Kocuria rhizophila]|uniref:CobW family GTP-binding protein n=1 Tax=Kocuria rhizophila TaxID=72000 RepID=UPI0021A833A1|nr:GTP-binding protein [Kocuria rhizophila]MCT1917019.1 hypothetical protein [Kocuria rhizophila]
MPSLSIVGGYLGAGKSTVVNRLLAGVLPGRTAVVVNDFGAVNIDASLISSRSEDTIELTNGCICCQITDDVQRTMTALARRSDLDHVVCEVSGVGDPGQLASWRRFPGFTAGPVLVCADATAIRRLLRDEFVGDTVARQLAAAETVLVTKTDLVSPAEVDAAAALVHAAAPHVHVHRQDRQDPAQTLRAIAAARPWHASGDSDLSAPRDSVPAASPGTGEDHAVLHRSCVLPSPAPVDVPRLVAVLSGLASSLTRAKGVVLDQDGTWQVVQLAGGRTATSPHTGSDAVPRDLSLVLIAAGPDAGTQLRSAAAALAPVLGSGCTPGA